jgi:hypothetical protein
LEGLGVVKRFFLVDIPLIMPQIKYIFIMTFIGSVQNYARTYILKSQGTTTIVERMYRAMFEEANYGLASAYATIIFDGKTFDREGEAPGVEHLSFETYGIFWRAWAARPTDEERAAAPWEE